MSEMTAAVRRSADSLTKASQALGDKASWSPLDKGRTALHQVGECALISGACAGIIANKAVPEFNWEEFGKANAALAADADAAYSLLAENTETLVAALEGLSADDAKVEVTMPWGETYTLAGLAQVVYWNNTYHEGQINYIQTLAAE